MTTEKLTSAQLAYWISESGFDVRRYSGRGMMGDQCVGFLCDNDKELGAVADIVACADDVAPALAKCFRAAKMDSMGRRCTIIYFPYMAWTDDCAETTSEDLADEEGDSEQMPNSVDYSNQIGYYSLQNVDYSLQMAENQAY